MSSRSQNGFDQVEIFWKLMVEDGGGKHYFDVSQGALGIYLQWYHQFSSFLLLQNSWISLESWKSIWRHLSHNLVLSGWTDIFAWDCSWGHCNRFVHRGGQFWEIFHQLITWRSHDPCSSDWKMPERFFLRLCLKPPLCALMTWQFLQVPTQ